MKWTPEFKRWDNHGFGAGRWHIDHIKPLASFNLRDAGQRTAAFHWHNLQPLWHDDNLRKGRKVL